MLSQHCIAQRIVSSSTYPRRIHLTITRKPALLLGRITRLPLTDDAARSKVIGQREDYLRKFERLLQATTTRTEDVAPVDMPLKHNPQAHLQYQS